VETTVAGRRGRRGAVRGEYRWRRPLNENGVQHRAHRLPDQAGGVGSLTGSRLVPDRRQWQCHATDTRS
jgi:hypothetical protein